MRQYNIFDGEGKLVRAYSLEELTRRYGTLHTVTRANLLSLLRVGIGDLPIDTGATVASIAQDAEHVDVTFSDGSTSTFDLVVGADGLHSQMRTLILTKDEFKYWDSKWGGWVFWSDPALAPANTVTEYWGAGRFVWMYPVDGRLGVFAGGPADGLKRSGVAGFAERARAQLESSAGKLREILDPAALSSDAFFWEFHDCRCTRWHRGRVVLLGDAATGFLPTAGVGASMAMESAAALADELSRTDARFVEQALAWARNQVMKHVPVEALIKDITGMIDQPI